MPSTLNSCLNMSPVFLWNMYPAEVGPNGNLVGLCLLNWPANVRYDDSSSILPCMTVIYLAYANLGSMLLTVGPLCNSKIDGLFNLAGSGHSHTIPLGLGTSMKLFNHSEDSSDCNGIIICCLCGHLNSFLNGHFSAYAMHLEVSCMACCLPLTCDVNVPSN